MDTAQQLDATFAAFDGWVGVGLGRMAIDDVFELSEMHPDATAARAAFQFADGWYQRSRDLALTGMETAVRAARRCGWEEQACSYAALAAAEQQRIDAMLQGAGGAREP